MDLVLNFIQNQLSILNSQTVYSDMEAGFLNGKESAFNMVLEFIEENKLSILREMSGE